MLTTDFDYNLPKEQIAQKPVEPRDHSKLMVVDKNTQEVLHKNFFNIVDFLREGDLLVWNNSKVFKARLYGKILDAEGNELLEHKKPIEVFLVRPMENEGVWKVLAKPGKHLANQMFVQFASDFKCQVLIKENDGTILVQFEDNEETVREKANKYGNVPLPPYIKDEKHELESYQNVYAKEEGSVAAPTAGFHFTKDLIEKLKAKGVGFAEVTLHVGLGTFLPVKAENLEDHIMHSEMVEISEETAEKINKAKKEGRRIIAVGTTSVRTLEGVAQIFGEVKEYTGDINLFIRPGFEFKVVDALITNFHLPKSTLLMLVSSFVGNTAFTLDLYNLAVEKDYRFFSFGDAMFIK